MGDHAILWHVRHTVTEHAVSLQNRIWCFFCLVAGGSEHTLDAQSNFDSGWMDGTVSQSNVSSVLCYSQHAIVHFKQQHLRTARSMTSRDVCHMISF
jgi:hypothetical protein